MVLLISENYLLPHAQKNLQYTRAKMWIIKIQITLWLIRRKYVAAGSTSSNAKPPSKITFNELKLKWNGEKNDEYVKEENTMSDVRRFCAITSINHSCKRVQMSKEKGEKGHLLYVGTSRLHLYSSRRLDYCFILSSMIGNWRRY